MKKTIILISIIFLSALISGATEQKTKGVDAVLSEIRQELGLKSNEKIDPDKVGKQKLEELGDAVMEEAIGNHAEHERMDLMMGGEGSRSLNAMHASMGYRYLSGLPLGMMGYGGMTGGPFNRTGFRGGHMMWNDGYGMMGWGYGGWFMGLIFLIVIIAIGVIIFFVIKNYRGTPSGETPIEILKKRYAKGEISKEDFERMKKDLQG